MTVTNSVLSSNGADNVGGAIDNSGTLTVIGSTLKDNESAGGGGISNTNSGAVTLTNSTLSGNTADTGGGIFNGGGALAITNSTLANNSGGAIYNQRGAAATTVASSTISGNDLGIFGNGAVTLTTTIVANSHFSDCSAPNLSDGGYNLDDDGTCGFSGTSLSGTPSGLDPHGLSHNGGITQTIALLGSSAAVDYVPKASLLDAFGNPLKLDQRGYKRPDAEEVLGDIGAYERQ
jgi:hypothetical protein